MLINDDFITLTLQKQAQLSNLLVRNSHISSIAGRVYGILTCLIPIIVDKDAVKGLTPLLWFAYGILTAASVIKDEICALAAGLRCYKNAQ